jgi:hypothetical protein
MDPFDAGYQGDLDDEISARLLIEINEGSVTLDEADRRHVVSAYDAEIRLMDLGFSQLIHYLTESGRLDRTLLVFTSDHGEEFGEHGQFGRHSHALYDELLRVPLLIRLPGGRYAGKVVDAQVRGIDILPTVTDVLGIRSPKSIDGTSLVPLMRRRRGADRVAVSQIDTAHPTVPTSIRTGPEKLIVGGPRFVEGAYRWYKDRVELTGPTSGVEPTVESFRVPRRLKISVDGEFLKEARIRPEKQPLSIPTDSPDARVTIESLTPCTRTEPLGLDLELPCVGFRVFNPFEYFRLSTDPEERHNRFDDPAHARAVERLRRKLDHILASRETPETVEIELDPTVRERLKALGYVD